MVEINWEPRIVPAERKPPAGLIERWEPPGTDGVWGVRKIVLKDGRVMFACPESDCEVMMSTKGAQVSHRQRESPHKPGERRRPFVDEVEARNAKAVALAEPIRPSAPVKPARPSSSRNVGQEALFDISGPDMVAAAQTFIGDLYASRQAKGEEAERLRSKVDQLVQTLRDIRTMVDTALGGITDD